MLKSNGIQEVRREQPSKLPKSGRKEIMRRN
jgi:hypothetical protein